MTPTTNLQTGLFIIYGSILCFNIILGTVLWMKTQARHYKLQAMACSALLMTGLLQGLVTNSPGIYQVLVSSLTFFGTLIFTELLCLVIGAKFRVKRYYTFYLAGLISTVLLYFIGTPLIISALPVLIAKIIPMLHTGLKAIFSKKMKVSIVAKCFAWAGVISSLHHLTYAFAVTHPEWLFLGFTFALLGILAVTTFSTATVLETLTTENTRIRMEADYAVMLASSARLASLGQMAGGVAHEINNPLAIIQMHAHQLKRILLDESFDRKVAVRGAGIIEDTVFRINKIITGLKSFGRDAGSDPIQMASLVEIVENTLQFTAERFESNGIEIRRNEFPDLFVICRPIQISQVIFNLFNNSFDALTSVTDRKWIKLQIEDDGLMVNFIISDNGSGVSPELKEKIFHPFFTTKEIGGGAGLGLSSSLGIIESNHGFLTFDDKSPFTTFVMSLPKA